MESTKEKKRKFVSPQNLKMVLIGAIIMVLLIPSAMIQSIITERKHLNAETETEIQETWGRSQVIGGPILMIPYYREVESEGKVTRIRSMLTLLPGSLSIQGEVIPEFRYRGIYKVVVYNSNLEFTGQFPELQQILSRISKENICWEDAEIQLGLSDLRGIQNNIQLTWDKTNYVASPGTSTNSPFDFGIHVPLKFDEKDTNNTHNFKLFLTLCGSQKIAFLPMGKTTKVNITSPWKTPKFEGAFLPKHRQIDKKGFSANWQVLHYNRNYPQEWHDRTYDIATSGFGVSFLVPVDRYQKSMRSVKYAILFLTLTFTLFFFIEILGQKQLALIQYFMVGLSLLLFYILLLSLSEHIGFPGAYLVASIAITLQITLFIHWVFRSLNITFLTAGNLLLLYAMLFLLLQLQDFALLIGSIGLFIVLGVIMYLSKKITSEATKY